MIHPLLPWLSISAALKVSNCVHDQGNESIGDKKEIVSSRNLITSAPATMCACVPDVCLLLIGSGVKTMWNGVEKQLEKREQLPLERYPAPWLMGEAC
jgi:hypothetical protein